MKYLPVSSELFVQNRRRLAKMLKPNSIAIFVSNDEMPRSADSHHTFRQNADLFYLTGIDQEKTILVLFPDHPLENNREILFIRRTNEIIAVWEGHKFTMEEAQNTSGIENIYWEESFENMLAPLMYQAQNCYLNLNEHSRMHNSVPDKEMRFARSMRESFPLHNYERAAPVMHCLRAEKSNIEIDLMRKAVDITGSAFRRVLGFVKPGVYEYEIEAEIQHEYLINRASGPAYPSIIASGKNSCILHYNVNNQVCQDGDVLLMDFGADYANYAADLTRTIPVNGRFSPRQLAVYNAVLRTLNFAKELLRPSTLIEEYHKEVGRFMESELIQLGLLDAKAVAAQHPDRPLYKKYFMHGTSHFLGIDVHDVGNRYLPLRAGMVLTCEPGIYIPEENLGIRLENDILVTNGSPVDLMENIPIDPMEIMELMNR